MQEISVVILTLNEETHLQRCLENVLSISKEVFVIDCFSTDNTVNIAEQKGAKVIQHKWPGNQAKQFNWALENLPVNTNWILRLDADEYLLPELVEEIKQKINELPEDITGVVFKRRHIFLGKWIKRGTYPVKLLRLFRYNKAICEQRWMDEHIELLEGTTIEFEHDFADHNLNNLTWWIQKHNGYAIREAIDLLYIELGLTGKEDGGWKSEDRGQKSEDRSQKSVVRSQTDFRPPTSDNPAYDLRPPTSALSTQAAAKRRKKLRYARQPLFWRSFAYFIYRYFFKLGFLEGKEGFLWHFLQGWWYRTLVDAKIWEIKRACGDDVDKIKEYVKKEYGMEV